MSEHEAVTLGQIRRELVRAVQRLLPIDADAARALVVEAVRSWSEKADAGGIGSDNAGPGTPGQDPVSRFIGEMIVCTVDPRARCRSSDLYAAWCEWCGRNGEDPGSNKRFSMALVERGFRKERTRACNVFVGIRLATGSGTTNGGNVG